MNKKNLKFDTEMKVIDEAEKKIRDSFTCFTYDAAYLDAEREKKSKKELNTLAGLVIIAKMQTGCTFIKC